MIKIPVGMPLIRNSLLSSYNLLTRKKRDPNAFIFTGESKVKEIDIQLYSYTKDELSEAKNVVAADIDGSGKIPETRWLNLYGLHDTDAIVSICRKFQIDSLTIQDILDVNQRPKYQEFDDYSFLTIKSVLPSGSSESESEQISFIMGDGYLISFQEQKADYFEHIRTRLREGIGIVRERGSDFLLYLMIESILDNYFSSLQAFEKEIEKLSMGKLQTDPSPEVLNMMEYYRRHIRMIRKTIYPIKEFTQMVERGDSNFIEKRHLKYFFELKDLTLTLIETCEAYEAELDSNINLFFSVQSQQMNQIMKTLTIVATVFIPLTFIVGVYGMNFANMPELGWRYGYAAVWLLMIICFAGMMVYFRRKKWF